MKTFLDVIHSADNADVLKSYRVNGMPIQFTAAQFKHVMEGTPQQMLSVNPLSSYIISIDMPTIVGTLKKINNNTIGITFKYSCEDCEGTGEIDCEECDGTGDCEYDKCGETHECGNCGGDGINECENVQTVHIMKILFYTEIDLNQGELF